MTDELPKVRTFEGDIAETIRDNQASVVSVALAEDKKRGGQEKEQQTPKHSYSRTKVFLLTGTIFIFASLILIGFSLYSKKIHTDQTQEPTDGAMSLIQADTSIKITFGENEVRSVALQKIQGAVPEKIPGDITRVIMYERIGTTTKEVQTDSFAKKFLGKIPNIFVRSVHQHFEYAIYQDTKERKPFFVFSVEDYERTYAGLLTWERTLFEDIAEPIGRERIKPDAEKPIFQDVVVKNNELRILRDAQGGEYLVYGFSGQNRLIIAFDAETFFIAQEMLRK